MVTINRNSVWKIFKQGLEPRIVTIVDIWGRGFLNCWEPVAYEIRDEETGTIVTRSREKLVALIEAGKMKREF